MAITYTKYGTSNQPITITLTSLAQSGARSSAVIDNSSNKHIDAMVGGYLTASSGGVGFANGIARLYAYGTSDGGSNYSDSASGDYAFVLNGNAMFLGSVVIDSSGEVVRFGPYSIAAAFGGILPEKWGVIVENVSGRPFNTVSNQYSVWYQGINFETV